MRQIQTISVTTIANALVKADERKRANLNPNIAPDAAEVDRVRGHLVAIAKNFGHDPYALKGDEPVKVQDYYLKRDAAGQYDSEKPVYI